MARIALVAAAIGANFGLGLLGVTGISGNTYEGTIFAVKASAVLTLLWIPFYAWMWKRYQTVFLPIILFPNPYFAVVALVMTACFTGGGCP